MYPMKNMRITQNYNGTVSHKPHWYNSKDYKDYPIDDGGLNGDKEAIYCPCDEMIVTAVKGVGNSATNTIWLVSTEMVKTPTFEDYAFMTLTHSDDSDFKNIIPGKTKFKRGEKIVSEGTDGATANHIHMVFGRGYSDNWLQNSNGSWVMSGDTKKPEEVCFIDHDFTIIHNMGDINWTSYLKNYGTPVSRDRDKNQIEILVDNLRARKTASVNDNNIVGYIKKGFYNYSDIKFVDNYNWYQVEKELWVAYSSNWATLFKKEEPVVIEPEEKEEEKEVNKEENIPLEKPSYIAWLITTIKAFFSSLLKKFKK